MSEPLRVSRWSEVFETAESKRYKVLTWISCPVSFNSTGFQDLLDSFEPEEAASLYGCWLALCQVAATAPTRGLLAGQRGEPYSASRICRLASGIGTPALFQKLMDWAVKNHWLESVPKEELPVRGSIVGQHTTAAQQVVADHPTDPQQLRNSHTTDPQQPPNSHTTTAQQVVELPNLTQPNPTQPDLTKEPASQPAPTQARAADPADASGLAGRLAGPLKDLIQEQADKPLPDLLRSVGVNRATQAITAATAGGMTTAAIRAAVREYQARLSSGQCRGPGALVSYLENGCWPEKPKSKAKDVEYHVAPKKGERP